MADDELTWTGPPRTPREYASRLVDVGLGTHAAALLEHVRLGVRLVSSPGAGDPEQARTRLGGRPLMADDALWPTTSDGRPLSFIAHVGCADIAPLLPDEPLPGSGLLSFFYDGVEQRAWGFDPSQSDCWAVTFAGAGTTLMVRDFPDDLEHSGRYSPRALVAVTEWTFPPMESAIVEALGVPDPWGTYGAVLGDDDGPGLRHRVLGHPDPIQNDMQLECQLTSNGIDTGGAYDTDPRTQPLVAGTTRWRLLLQVDSAEDLGMMWGDVGRLYWWMHEDALREHDWGRAWFVLQCC